MFINGFRSSKGLKQITNCEVIKRIDAFCMATVIGEVKTENPNRKKRTPFSYFTAGSWQIHLAYFMYYFRFQILFFCMIRI